MQSVCELLSYCAAVLISCITGLAHLSVPYGVLTQKQKGVEKSKLVRMFDRAGLTGVLILSSKGLKMSCGRTHNMLSLSCDIFLV